MLVSTNELVQKAYINHYAVPAINVNELDSIFALFRACEELQSPVIIQIAPIQIKNRPFGYKELIQIIKTIGKNYNVDYSIHLDHGDDISNIIYAGKLGFSSVMFDGSHLQLLENIKGTNDVKKELPETVNLEAELGVLGVKEGGQGEELNHVYTNLEEARKFLSETNIDMLAIAIGNSHGIYKQTPKLNIELLKILNKKLCIPLVLHGASGLSKEDIGSAIKEGIAKINFFTDIDFSYTDSFKDKFNDEKIYTFMYLQNVYENIEEKIKEKIRMCKSENRI